MASDLRSRKRVAMREAISDAATRLFLERGFDRVTVDEIATAADVGRKTVFNHFPRKEDLFFDRDEEIREILRATLQHRDPSIAPIEACRLLAHRLVAQRSPYVAFSAASRLFVETIEGSEALKARARELRDELARFLATTLATLAGRHADDADAHLAATLLLATWTAARIRAHRVFQRSRSAGKAKAAFLAAIDQGTIGVTASMTGSPYA